jgi:putative ABC transport system substrate-binding protein
MKRRRALAVLFALAVPLSVRSQPRAQLPRIALVDPGLTAADVASPDSLWGLLVAELRRFGYVEGKNVAIQRWGGGGAAQDASYKELAKKVVASRPSVIVVPGRSMYFVAAETTAIPVIAVGSFSPEFQARRARPGSNLTGIDMGFDQQQLYAKQVEVFARVLKPGARVAWLGTKAIWDGAIGEAARRGAKASRLVLHPVFVAPVNQRALRQAFAEIAQAKVDGVFVSPAVEMLQYRNSVAQMAIASRLPSLGPTRYWAEAGALLSYGVDYDWAFRRAANMVDRILKGAQPGSIPIENPTNIELVVNVRTAKSLKLAIPLTIIQRADRVIE